MGKTPLLYKTKDVSSLSLSRIIRNYIFPPAFVFSFGEILLVNGCLGHRKSMSSSLKPAPSYFLWPNPCRKKKQMKNFRLSRKKCSLPVSLSHFLCFLLYGAWTMTCNKPTDRIFIANPHVLKKGTKWVLVFSALFCLGWQRPQMHDYDPMANIPSFALSHFSFTWILL